MTGQLTNLLSFRRIADTPFDTYMAVLDSWQLARHDGELRLSNSLPHTGKQITAVQRCAYVSEGRLHQKANTPRRS
jgi:hypothetical protein